MSDLTFTAEQRAVLTPVLEMLRALPLAERPELIEALVSQFIEVFREDWPERGEDEVQRYGDLVRISLSTAVCVRPSSQAKTA